MGFFFSNDTNPGGVRALLSPLANAFPGVSCPETIADPRHPQSPAC